MEKSRFVINKSRYDSIDSYLSKDKRFRPEYNDIDLVYDKEICEKLQREGKYPSFPFLGPKLLEKKKKREKKACEFTSPFSFITSGVDELLARHVAHLFIRDPLVIFKELLDQDDLVSTDHFEVPSCNVKCQEGIRER